MQFNRKERTMPQPKPWASSYTHLRVCRCDDDLPIIHLRNFPFFNKSDNPGHGTVLDIFIEKGTSPDEAICYLEKAIDLLKTNPQTINSEVELSIRSE
jgi:hypothetical protein